MKALTAGLALPFALAVTFSSMEQPATNPASTPSPTPQLRPSNTQMVEAWNEVVKSIDEEIKALKEENDAFFQLQASLKLHAPWVELDIEGKHRLNRAALVEQIIDSHHRRMIAYEKRIALLRKLQESDR